MILLTMLCSHFPTPGTSWVTKLDMPLSACVNREENEPRQLPKSMCKSNMTCSISNFSENEGHAPPVRILVRSGTSTLNQWNENAKRSASIRRLKRRLTTDAAALQMYFTIGIGRHAINITSIIVPTTSFSPPINDLRKPLPTSENLYEKPGSPLPLLKNFISFSTSKPSHDATRWYIMPVGSTGESSMQRSS